ncbi:uncharacterized protein LOC126282245 [Schistocerca gregaria]|uniref:uncharacterized protein LOC126282245 n=1 Tax=Schistocerca gregaria TaxID=7010 RepID=UPI00211DAB73|nr:uncharacterized protein LOC126282245 [Schistocerca gregaria]
MKGGLVLLIAGVLLVVYCTPLAAADDGDEVAEEVGENRDADDDDTDSIADEDDDDDSGFNWGLVEVRRQALKGAHARAGHAKHARAGSRHAAGRAANRPHARTGAARRAAHSK